MAERSVAHRTKVPEIRKGDRVVVLSGRDAGKSGVVERVLRRDPATSGARTVYRRGSGRGGIEVVVEGINVARRHTKPRQVSGGPNQMPRIQQGGILDIAQPLPVGKVMLVCPHCDRPTRISHTTLANGRRVRACRHCGEQLEARS